MPTAFQFSSTQLTEIARLRKAITDIPDNSTAGGGAALYSYIFKCATGIDLSASILTSPIDTVWQTSGIAPLPDENRKALTWLYGALQVNTGAGAFSQVIREYNIRQGELRGKGTFSQAKLDEASNAVAVLFADSILNPLDGLGRTNPTYKKLPTLQEIGNTDLNGVRNVLYPGNESSDKELYLNQAWPGIVMLGSLGGQYTDRLLRYDDTTQPIALDSLADFKAMLFAWDAFKTAWDKTPASEGTIADALIAINWPASFASTAVNEYNANGATSFAQFVFSTLAASQNAEAKKGLDAISQTGSNQFLDMLMGAVQGKSLIGTTTTDAQFKTNAMAFLGALNTTQLQAIGVTLMPTSADAIDRLAQTDVNARSALAALSLVKVQVSNTVASQLGLFDPITNVGGFTKGWLTDRSTMLSDLAQRIRLHTDNCVKSQAFSTFITFIFSFHGVPDLTMAFKIVNSLPMHATKATFFAFPAASRR